MRLYGQHKDALYISDKAVSNGKWFKLPDIALFNNISKILDVSINSILQGDLYLCNREGGKMKNTNFYICENCSSISISTGEVQISCCGRNIAALKAKKAKDSQKLTVESLEDEWYIYSAIPCKRITTYIL